MDDEVWGGLDLQLQATDIAGLYRAAADDLHDPFWPALADCAESFLAGDSTCFGVGDVDLAASAHDKVEDMVVGMDTGGFLAEDGHLIQQQEPVYSSSSSKRTLSIDSGNTSSALFALDDAAFAGAAATAAGIFSPSSRHPAAPAPRDAFTAADDDAIMRAMMAVLSSASPSSSESSSPPTVQPRVGNGHVMVKSTSPAVAPERTSATSGCRQQQQGEARTAPDSNNNSSQVYHVMSERKRREKLNDSFQTLRSLLPPCSKTDKTTVLINAASYLKTLGAQVSELEEKNAKLERHVPREDGGSAATATAAHRRAKVQISRAASESDKVNLTVMVMVECDIVDLMLHVLECLRWMAGVSVLSVDADTYSPQVLFKAIASIKLQITDGECWNEASFHEAMTKAVHDATSSSSSCATPLVVAA